MTDRQRMIKALEDMRDAYISICELWSGELFDEMQDAFTAVYECCDVPFIESNNKSFDELGIANWCNGMLWIMHDNDTTNSQH